MWNLILKIYKRTYLQNRDRLTDIKNKLYVYQGGNVEGRDTSGAWAQHIHTIIYEIDNQQGHTVQHRELYSIF